MTFQSLSGSAAVNPKQKSQGPLTQKELREAVVRLGTSYLTALTSHYLFLVREAASATLRANAQGQFSAISTSILGIVTGAKPEINLLDMMVLATLLRMTFEDYWIPKVYGAQGMPLLRMMKKEEQALWSLSDKVLNTGQQRRLRQLIIQWRQTHRDQIDVEGVRLTDFATGDDVQSLQPRGLLPEITEVTRAIDESRVLAERLAILLLYLPNVTLFQVRAALHDTLAEPEAQQFLSDMTALTAATDRFSKTADALPERLSVAQGTLISEFMDRFAQERAAAVHQIREEFRNERRETVEDIMTRLEQSNDELRGILIETQRTLAIGQALASSTTAALKQFDVIAVKLGWDQVDENNEPFNILAYRDTVHGLRDAAQATHHALQSADHLLSVLDSPPRNERLNALMETLDQHIQRWLLLAFLLGVISILIVRSLTALGKKLFLRQRE